MCAMTKLTQSTHSQPSALAMPHIHFQAHKFTNSSMQIIVTSRKSGYFVYSMHKCIQYMFWCSRNGKIKNTITKTCITSSFAATSAIQCYAEYSEFLQKKLYVNVSPLNNIRNILLYNDIPHPNPTAHPAVCRHRMGNNRNCVYPPDWRPFEWAAASVSAPKGRPSRSSETICQPNECH